MAAELQSLGLRPGDKVAVVGYGLTNHWARLARLRTIAEAASGARPVATSGLLPRNGGMPPMSACKGPGQEW